MPDAAIVCQQVAEVLGHIEAGGLLPPLVVLQALARNPALKLDVVREYMARALGAEAAAADEDCAAVARYQAETAGMRAEVAELRTQVPAPRMDPTDGNKGVLTSCVGSAPACPYRARRLSWVVSRPSC